MSAQQKLNIIYDGQCAFCIRSLRVIKALDVRGVMVFHDSHDPETLKRFAALRNADVNEAMFSVSEDEPIYRGFFALRRLLWVSPLLWPLIPLFYFPGMSWIGTRVYAWVARNRTRFGCHSDFCSLPTEPRVQRVRQGGDSVHL
ncbi:MAG: DUF393 domain-containing protein [Acidobacteria bacterium]|nr:DUF393 domain-containing protein [Acidobacteriota bacterium]